MHGFKMAPRGGPEGSPRESHPSHSRSIKMLLPRLPREENQEGEWDGEQMDSFEKKLISSGHSTEFGSGWILGPIVFPVLVTST